jgi:peptidoglycan hydrolase-like protein with peptidoglycan-binding domain
MTTITQTVSKVAALAAGFALVASVAVAPLAHAQTTTTTSTTMTAAQVASLEAQIASLQAQLSSSQGTTMMSTTFTTDLTIGSTGSQVTALQTWLISKGYSIPAGATGYFGAQTKAAVAAWQAAAGISPAAGYFGPISRAKLNAMGSTTTTTTTTTTGGTTTTGSTTLSGGEGSIDNFQYLGSPSNTSLYQGQAQQVFGFQFNADGSDLQINRVDFDVTNTGVAVNGNNLGGQDRPWAILQTATLYDGSNVIGTVDASNQNNWSQDGNLVTGHQTYRLRFDNLNDVVKMGSQPSFYVAFTAQNGVSNANQTQYQVVLADQGVRATDAQGIEQYSPSNTATTSSAQVFTVSNGTAGTVTFSTGSDNPQASTVMANQSSNTQNVVLNTFTIQAQSAATQIYDLPVELFVSNTNINPVQDLKLYEGTTLIDSESVNSTTFATTTTPTASPVSGVSTQQQTTNGVVLQGATVLFNNLTNLVIPAGTTQNFSIEADINPVGGTNTGNAVEGAAVLATVNPTLAGTDIEQGSNRVTATGASTGNLVTFHVNGLSPDAVPTTSATVALNGGSNTTQQKGTFTFTFNVTAFGEDVFVSSTTNGYSVALTDTSNGTRTTTASTTAITSSADISPLGNYVVHSGQSKSITISAALSGGYGDYWYATLSSLKYGLTDANPLTSTASLTTNYRTQPVSINS